MEKRKINHNLTLTLIAFAMSVLSLFGLLFGAFTNTAYAEVGINYTNALADLEKDENFNKEDYPANDKDFTLKVIQVAESSEKELFVYVYQPCWFDDNLRATSINISTAINESLSYKNYTLTFLNSNGVFYKYKVNDFELKSDIVRYYDIASIFRKWNEKYDKKPDNENTVDEISFEVGLRWTVCNYEGKVYYNCTGTETILITSKRVGYITYDNGFSLRPKACCSHYVAFSTDKRMDTLMEADVEYVYQDCTGQILDTGIWPITWETNGEKQKGAKTLRYDEEASNPADGLFGKKYTWKRIEKVADFVKNPDNKLKEDTKEDLKDKQWVLRFLETDNIFTSYPMGYRKVNFTEVSEVTILRLKFETDGVTYNLGVVDNKQTGGLLPDNKPSSRLLKILIAIVVGIILFIALMPLLPQI